MSRRSKHLWSLVLLVTLGFAQSTLVLAACAIDRANLAQVLAAQDMQCCDTDTMTGDSAAPMTPTLCLAHSTTDLQALGTPILLGHPPSLMPLSFYVPRFDALAVEGWSVPPPNVIPPRILFQSFQV